MLSNKEKDLLLKLLIEKALESKTPNLQIVGQSSKSNYRKKIKRHFPHGVKAWSNEELNLLKIGVTLGKSDEEIAEQLGDRSIASVSMRRWRLKSMVS